MNVLITGAKSGIGLELVRQFVSSGNLVVATGRNMEEVGDIMEIKRNNSASLFTIELDITNESSIVSASLTVARLVERLDIVINSVGIYDEPVLGEIKMEDCLGMFMVNAFGPLLVIQELLPLIASKKGKIVNISGGMGSIANVTKGGHYNYSASKAALNMYSKILSKELNQREITVITVDPGWVRTRLGGPEAPLSVVESASSLIEIIRNVDLKVSGSFFHISGRELPW